MPPSSVTKGPLNLPSQAGSMVSDMMPPSPLHPYALLQNATLEAVFGELRGLYLWVHIMHIPLGVSRADIHSDEAN